MQNQDLGKLFKEVIGGYFRKFSAGVTSMICPDQYVGDILGNGFAPPPYVDRTSHPDPINYEGFYVRQPPDEAPLNPPRIILILESPHIVEFLDATNTGPAKGDAGAKIRENFGFIVNKYHFITDAQRPVILMNAIRLQCSTGINTQAHRDDIFRLLWNKRHIRQDFSRRIVSYTENSPGYTIINACTKGKKSNSQYLRMLVEAEIGNSLNHGSHLCIPHPASWRRRDEDGCLIIEDWRNIKTTRL